MLTVEFNVERTTNIVIMKEALIVEALSVTVKYDSPEACRCHIRARTVATNTTAKRLNSFIVCEILRK